jgi:dinuclear metal center YbgI/SA1388 family protein
MARRRRHPTLKDLLDAIEEMAPAALAESYDNVGLQVGDLSRRISRVLVGLEVTDALIDEARRRRADTLVVHHPLFFLPIRCLEESDHVGHLARRLVQADLAVVAAHTNLDKSPEGTGPALARELGFRDWEVLLPESPGRRFKYVVFVPKGHEAAVIEAIARAGGGVIGDYDHCTFRTAGTGTFRGGAGTKPAIGQAGRLEQVEEFRLEAVVPGRALSAVIESVRAAHPYEEVAHDVYPLESAQAPWGLGVRSTLARPTTLKSWARRVKRRLGLKAVRVVGDPAQSVRTVAVATGACDFLIRELAPPHVDCLVTGDVKYHMAVEARSKGLGVVDPGHWASEVIVAEPLAAALRRRLRDRGCEVDVMPTRVPDADPLVTL